MYDDVVQEFMDYEAQWETIDTFKYLLEKPTNEDDISVKSYQPEAGATKAFTAGLSIGQKKNLAIKKKTLCEKAWKIWEK